MVSFRSVIGIVIVGFASSNATGADWSQWNGPTRDGNFSFTGKISFENAEQPVWKREIGLGYSGPIVSGDRVVVTDYLMNSGEITNKAGKRDKLSGDERISCFAKSSGELLWQHSYQRDYEISYPSGPRATPVIESGKVFALGSEGDLLCLDLVNGQVIWQVSFTDKFGAQTPLWGHAASPLVYGDELICMVGGKGSLVVAFDLETGAVKWKALTQEKNETGYCPPTIVKSGEVAQLMIWSPTTLYSLDPDTGSVHWQSPLVPAYGMSILPPVTGDGLLFVSGEGSKSAMFELDADEPNATLAWRGTTKTSAYLATSNAIFRDGHIYGADIRSGALICFEAQSGTRKWQTAVPTTGSSRGRGQAHGSAFLINLGESYLVLSETGDLIHAELNPEGYNELSRFHAIEPTTKTMGRMALWTYPAFDGEHVFIRNDKHLVSYRVVAE